MAAEERCAYGDTDALALLFSFWGLFDSRQKHKVRRCHKHSGQCS